MTRSLSMTLACVAMLAGPGAQAQDASERVAAMEAIARHTDVLGNMVTGKTGFDAARAREAADAIAAQADRLPSLYAQPISDAESEASPAIWENWSDFTAIAADMGAAADSLETGSAQELRAGLGALGATCRGCHTRYRK